MMRGGIETLPRHILHDILRSGRLDALDLVSLEVSCQLFRAESEIPPYQSESLTESAAHHLCRIHGLFQNFPWRAQSALLLRCGRNWKLVLHFLQSLVHSSQRSNVGNNVLVGAGMFHTVAVNKEGELYISTLAAPYYTRFSLPGTNRPVIHISTLASSEHVAVVTDVGEVYTFKHYMGNLDEAREEDLVVSTPTLVTTLQQTPFNQVAIGHAFALAITRAGDVFSWGRNSCGQLGHGDKQYHFTPLQIEHFNKSNPVVQVSAGYAHALAVTKSGQLFSWGQGWCFQLGHDNNLDVLQPKRVEHGGFDDLFIASVCAGDEHSAALDSSGHVYTWGSGLYGALGHGVETDQRTPLLVAGLERFRAVQVEAGTHRTLVLTDNGVVHSFGWVEKFSLGMQGQVDEVTTHKVLSPEPLELAPQGHKVAVISAGSEHTVVLTKKNAFFGFGCNDCGQLGIARNYEMKYFGLLENERTYRMRDFVPPSTQVFTAVTDVAQD